MIDDKKIEAAKEEIYEDRFLLNGEEIVFNNDEKEEMFYEGDIKEAIGLGAKWAINEFLKNLWHPASEAPKRRCNYLLLHYKDKEEECFEADVVDTKAWDCYIKGSLVEYINIDGQSVFFGKIQRKIVD